MPDDPMEDDENTTNDVLNNFNNNKTGNITFRLVEENDFPEEQIVEEETIEYADLNFRNNSVNRAVDMLNIRFKQEFEEDKAKRGTDVFFESEEILKSLIPNSAN